MSERALGKIIRERRTALKITGSELGRRVGVDQTTVSKWENGKISPRRQMVVPIARALDLDPSELWDAYTAEVEADAETVRKENQQLNSAVNAFHGHMEAVTTRLDEALGLLEIIVPVVMGLPNADQPSGPPPKPKKPGRRPRASDSE